MELPPLPHVYPFRFVESVVRERDEHFQGGEVSASVTVGERACSGTGWQSPFLLAEMIAQSALLLEGGDAEIGKGGFLAALDNFEILRSPSPGEKLRIRVDLVATYGLFAKFAGRVSSSEEQSEIARGEILVRRGAAST
jgi:3-hydroxymyristoyl/3-hydroxydecanoyl-(acyl carrier protein) dehydratase